MIRLVNLCGWVVRLYLEIRHLQEQSAVQARSDYCPSLVDSLPWVLCIVIKYTSITLIDRSVVVTTRIITIGKISDC